MSTVQYGGLLRQNAPVHMTLAWGAVYRNAGDVGGSEFDPLRSAG